MDSPATQKQTHNRTRHEEGKYTELSTAYNTSGGRGRARGRGRAVVGTRQRGRKGVTVNYPENVDTPAKTLYKRNEQSRACTTTPTSEMDVDTTLNSQLNEHPRYPIRRSRSCTSSNSSSGVPSDTETGEESEESEESEDDLYRPGQSARNPTRKSRSQSRSSTQGIRRKKPLKPAAQATRTHFSRISSPSASPLVVSNDKSASRKTPLILGLSNWFQDHPNEVPIAPGLPGETLQDATTLQRIKYPPETHESAPTQAYAMSDCTNDNMSASQPQPSRGSHASGRVDGAISFLHSAVPSLLTNHASSTSDNVGSSVDTDIEMGSPVSPSIGNCAPGTNDDTSSFSSLVKSNIKMGSAVTPSLGKRRRASSLSEMEMRLKVTCAHTKQSIPNHSWNKEIAIASLLQLSQSNESGRGSELNSPSSPTCFFFKLKSPSADNRDTILVSECSEERASCVTSSLWLGHSMPCRPSASDLAVSMDDEEATPRPRKITLPQDEAHPIRHTNGMDLDHQVTTAANTALLDISSSQRQANRDHQATQLPASEQTRTNNNEEVQRMSGESGRWVTALKGKGLNGGLIGLTEYIHNELLPNQIRASLSLMKDDVSKGTWSDPPPPLVGSNAMFVLQRFERIQIPTRLFPKTTPITRRKRPSLKSDPSSRSEYAYLTIAVYIHLLGLRAVTSARTGTWEMPMSAQEKCSLAKFTLEVSSVQSPHNQRARAIFTPHFMAAAAASLYCIRSITGSLFTEDNVSIAFYHALRVQISLQTMSAQDEGSQAIHRQERREATKIGKWLLLHQVVKMAGIDDLPKVIAKMGPDLCSSDESDMEIEADEVSIGDRPEPLLLSGSVIPNWRGPALAAVLSDLRKEGLYYGRAANRHVPGYSRRSNKIPPLGTPLSWIDNKYLDVSGLN